MQELALSTHPAVPILAIPTYRPIFVGVLSLPVLFLSVSSRCLRYNSTDFLFCFFIVLSVSFDLKFPSTAFYDGCYLDMVFCLDSLDCASSLSNDATSYLSCCLYCFCVFLFWIWGVCVCVCVCGGGGGGGGGRIGDYDDTCLVLNADISFLGWVICVKLFLWHMHSCSFLAEMVSVRGSGGGGGGGGGGYRGCLLCFMFFLGCSWLFLCA